MMYDIAALQTEYGANYTTNSGDTVYSWDPHDRAGIRQRRRPGRACRQQDLHDALGRRRQRHLRLLTTTPPTSPSTCSPAAWTTTSTTQLANLGGGHNAAGNIANALLYQGNTRLADRERHRRLGQRHDHRQQRRQPPHRRRRQRHLDGGGGTDTAVYSGNLSDYLQVQNVNGSWTITDLRAGSPDGIDTLNNIEQLQFNDGVVAIGSAPTPVVQAPTIVSFSNDTGALGDGITE